MTGTSSYNDEDKSRILNKHPNGEYALYNGVSAAQILTVARTSINVSLWVMPLLCHLVLLSQGKVGSFFSLKYLAF